MDASSLDFLKKLLHSPAPSGYEGPIQDVVREFAGEFADEVTTDLHGNVIAAVNPKAERRVMFAGHCDQIGLLVQYIDDDGYLWANLIGGWDIQMLLEYAGPYDLRSHSWRDRSQSHSSADTR